MNYLDRKEPDSRSYVQSYIIGIGSVPSPNEKDAEDQENLVPSQTGTKENNQSTTDNSSSRAPSSLAVFGSVVSLFSLMVSLGNFYYSSLRASNVSIQLGGALEMTYEYDGNLGIIAALAYSNTGARPSTVTSTKLTCGQVGSSEQTDLFPIYYVEFVSNGGTALAGIPTPEVVKGGDQFTKSIQFWSEANWNKTHYMQVGEYKCVLFAAFDHQPKLTERAHMTFPVRKEDIDHINVRPLQNRYIFTHESGVKGPMLILPY